MDDKLQNIKDIGSNQLSEKLKSNAHSNMRGAVLGGVVGVVVGVASRKNIYITGIIGLILGRLFLTKK